MLMQQDVSGGELSHKGLTYISPTLFLVILIMYLGAACSLVNLTDTGNKILKFFRVWQVFSQISIFILCQLLQSLTFRPISHSKIKLSYKIANYLQINKIQSNLSCVSGHLLALFWSPLTQLFHAPLCSSYSRWTLCVCSLVLGR